MAAIEAGRAARAAITAELSALLGAVAADQLLLALRQLAAQTGGLDTLLTRRLRPGQRTPDRPTAPQATTPDNWPAFCYDRLTLTGEWPMARIAGGDTVEVQIKSKDFKVTEGLRAFIQGRVNKLDRFIGRVTDAKLELTHEHPRTGGARIIAQLTVATRHTILRAEEQHADAERAVDMAVGTMMSQIRRYHSKRIDRSRRPSVAEFVALPELEAADLAELDAAIEDEVGTDGQRIARTKRFALKPMTGDEAIDQLELLGHDFFVFRNADDDQVNVLYRRKGGDYGLIQPQ